MLLMRWNRSDYVQRWIWSLTFTFGGSLLLDGVNSCVTPNTLVLAFLGRWLPCLAFVALILLMPTMLVFPFLIRQEAEPDYSKLSLLGISLGIILASAFCWIVLNFLGMAINPYNKYFTMS